MVKNKWFSLTISLPLGDDGHAVRIGYPAELRQARIGVKLVFVHCVMAKRATRVTLHIWGRPVCSPLLPGRSPGGKVVHVKMPSPQGSVAECSRVLHDVLQARGHQVEI
jgi:hypothetical protein